MCASLGVRETSVASTSGRRISAAPLSVRSWARSAQKLQVSYRHWCGASSAGDVVLTRERGKNGKLARLLAARDITWVEIPLVETAAGDDRDKLVEVLRSRTFEWIAITSPEAASVFLEGWDKAGQPQVRIAVVGEGSGKILKKRQQGDLLTVDFVPSKANAKHLAAELPLSGQSPNRILYPASAKAADELEVGLAARGCQVCRLDTYTTLPVTSLTDGELKAAREAPVLAVASPSAIEAWVALAQPDLCQAIACIGQTSAKAAERLGFQNVFAPDSPGLDGFMQAVQEALDACKQPSH